MSKEFGGIPSQPRSAGDAEPSGAARTIYVVGGTTGEYSDRSEWLVRAFETEGEAQAYVEFLGVERQKLAAPIGDWDARVSVEQAMRAFDPYFHEDYTGTSWWVSEVPLVLAGAKPKDGTSSPNDPLREAKPHD